MLLSAIVASVSLGATAGATASEARAVSAEDDVPGDPARVDLKIVRGKTVIKHPGLVAEMGREVVLSLTEKDRKHEVALLFDREGGDASRFKVVIKYKSGARALQGERVGGVRDWITLEGKGVKVQVRIDPDRVGLGDIDITPTDDPLEGFD